MEPYRIREIEQDMFEDNDRLAGARRRMPHGGQTLSPHPDELARTLRDSHAAAHRDQGCRCRIPFGIEAARVSMGNPGATGEGFREWTRWPHHQVKAWKE